MATPLGSAPAYTVPIGGRVDHNRLSKKLSSAIFHLNRVQRIYIGKNENLSPRNTPTSISYTQIRSIFLCRVHIVPNRRRHFIPCVILLLFPTRIIQRVIAIARYNSLLYIHSIHIHVLRFLLFKKCI